MDKRHLHHLHKRFQIVNVWYFLAAAILFFVVGIYGLRENNLHMVQLRDAVIKADQENGDVDAALNDLRSFVFAHMNTNLASGDFAIKPPIQLKARYDRLVEAENARVQAANKAVAAQADAYCGQIYPVNGPNIPRITCVQQYVSSHAVKEQTIPAALYKFDFISPRWSPDLAGVSLVLAAISFLFFVVRFGVERWFMRQIK